MTNQILPIADSHDPRRHVRELVARHLGVLVTTVGCCAFVVSRGEDVGDAI